MRIPARVVVCVFALALPSLAQAGPITFNPNPITGAFPDIKTNPTTITYNTGQVCSFAGNTFAGCLTIVGDNTKLTRFSGDAGLSFNAAEPNDYTLLAAIDSAGVFHGGTINVVGGLPAPYNTAPGTTTLTGSLTQFGLVVGSGGLNDAFNFLANVTDPLGLGFGSLAGIVVSTSGNFVNGTNPFSQNFGLTSFNVGQMDTFMQAAQVPEPGSLLLLATGGALVVLRRRYRRSKKSVS